jgi:hypothetical protein
MIAAVPEELWPELVRLRWQERQTYAQIQARYPYYSLMALWRAIAKASHRTYYRPSCVWCERRFQTTMATQRFCSDRCLHQHQRYHHDLNTATRPPQEMAQRRCVVCDELLGPGRYANAIYCGARCRNRQNKQREKARKGMQGG